MLLKSLLLFASLSGLVSVALGAFGAHGLRGQIDDSLLHAFETGVNYQMMHSLSLLAVCLLIIEWGDKVSLQVAGIGFVLGILLFSGSLYGLALTGMKWLGPVTPLGGLAFMVGWTALVIGVWNQQLT